jgi:YaaC-like Protein
MPRVAAPRTGSAVQVLGRPLRFSYWPMYRTTRRYGLQAQLYATNPWALIRAAIQRDCPAASRAEALAYLAQAEFFFDAGTKSTELAATPLLLYYSFMNVAKAYILTRSVRTSLDQARHGLTERLGPGGKELVDAYLEGYSSPANQRANVFALFWQALTGHRLATQIRLDLRYLMPQIVTGHRLWCDAGNVAERFIAIEHVQLLQNTQSHQLWTVLQIHSGTMSQHSVTSASLLRGTGLQNAFRSVQGYSDTQANETMLQFEQVQTIPYTHRPSDSIPQLVESFRHSLWTTAITTRPFREYYLYVAPAAERMQVLPQLMSVYALTFYLGSVTRYRPQYFDSILESKFGGLLEEFLTTQPTQFLYLLASEFARREITRPALA